MTAPQAVVDDSGSEPQSRVFVLAGLVSTNAGWAEFANDWRAVLEEPPALDYFKMTLQISVASSPEQGDGTKATEMTAC
jgi:hypothetical protein